MQTSARSTIGLRPCLSATAPQIGPMSAAISGVMPEMRPAQKAASARSSTPSWRM